MRTMVCEQCDREPKNAFLALRSRTLSKRSSAALLAASPAPLADGRGPCVFATRTRPRPRGSRGLTTPRPVATKQGSIARCSLPPRIIVRPHPCFRQRGCGVESSRAESSRIPSPSNHVRDPCCRGMQAGRDGRPSLPPASRATARSLTGTLLDKVDGLRSHGPVTLGSALFSIDRLPCCSVS
jgi:hypothetical protein